MDFFSRLFTLIPCVWRTPKHIVGFYQDSSKFTICIQGTAKHIVGFYQDSSKLNLCIWKTPKQIVGFCPDSSNLTLYIWGTLKHKVDFYQDSSKLTLYIWVTPKPMVDLCQDLWQSIIDTHKFAIFIRCHIKKTLIYNCYILRGLVQLSLVTNVRIILNDVVI